MAKKNNGQLSFNFNQDTGDTSASMDFDAKSIGEAIAKAIKTSLKEGDIKIEVENSNKGTKSDPYYKALVSIENSIKNLGKKIESLGGVSQSTKKRSAKESVESYIKRKSYPKSQLEDMAKATQRFNKKRDYLEERSRINRVISGQPKDFYEGLKPLNVSPAESKKLMADLDLAVKKRIDDLKKSSEINKIANEAIKEQKAIQDSIDIEKGIHHEWSQRALLDTANKSRSSYLASQVHKQGGDILALYSEAHPQKQKTAQEIVLENLQKQASIEKLNKSKLIGQFNNYQGQHPDFTRERTINYQGYQPGFTYEQAVNYREPSIPIKYDGFPTEISIKQKREQEKQQREQEKQAKQRQKEEAKQAKQQQKNIDKRNKTISQAFLSFLPGGGGINNIFRMIGRIHPLLAVGVTVLGGILGALNRALPIMDAFNDLLSLIIYSGIGKVIKFIKGRSINSTSNTNQDTQKLAGTPPEIARKIGSVSVDGKRMNMYNFHGKQVVNANDLGLYGGIAQQEAPYVPVENIGKLKELDKYYQEKRLKPVYTSFMGGQHAKGSDLSRSHWGGGKLDTQFFGSGGNSVRLSKEIESDLDKSLKGNGAVGYEAPGTYGHKGHVYDLGYAHMKQGSLIKDYKAPSVKVEYDKNYINYQKEQEQQLKQEEVKKEKENNIVTVDGGNKKKGSTPEVLGTISYNSNTPYDVTGNSLFESTLQTYNMLGGLA